MLNSFYSWMKPRKEGSTGDSQGGDTFLNVEKGCLFLLTACMPAFFDHLREEEHPGVRTVLGHWVFVYIHPYLDGNGRMGRFLMNVMLASGGYPWTVVPVDPPL
jgi:Fic family protein